MQESKKERKESSIEENLEERDMKMIEQQKGSNNQIDNDAMGWFIIGCTLGASLLLYFTYSYFDFPKWCRFIGICFLVIGCFFGGIQLSTQKSPLGSMFAGVGFVFSGLMLKEITSNLILSIFCFCFLVIGVGCAFYSIYKISQSKRSKNNFLFTIVNIVSVLTPTLGLILPKVIDFLKEYIRLNH
ncbi:hypothetical protein [Rummeliibacillus stabekisii]|uniref:hypothetical protein n=1 Tax=Rummeliibacillus stabekisii TaxID=241244 RepID=UPI0011683B53|nr:hypothetical protein [Rummeliibacillus stabekisii]MBB5171600.1 putative membrane protein AbrB (regulator of aidB expression) [Rummeliibacillus stabekisii]GEL05447.1 hypothetical protein RST01_20740 [Rummeliibacillus stabekisii]